MSERPTPETDTLRKTIDNGADVEAMMTSLARKLERERDEARDVLRMISVADWKTAGELRGMARRALEAAK